MSTSSSSEAVRMMEFALSKLTECPFTARMVSPVREREEGEGGGRRGRGEGERGRGGDGKKEEMKRASPGWS